MLSLKLSRSSRAYISSCNNLVGESVPRAHPSYGVADLKRCSSGDPGEKVDKYFNGGLEGPKEVAQVSSVIYAAYNLYCCRCVTLEGQPCTAHVT